MLGPLAFVLVLVVGACVTWGTRRALDPTPGVVAAVAAWLVFGGYVLPWYTVWALPAAAMLVRGRLSWLVAVQGAVITAAFVIPRSTITAGGLVSIVVRYVAPIALVVMFVWAVVPEAGFRRRRQGSAAFSLNGMITPIGWRGAVRRSTHADGTPLVPRQTRGRRPRAAPDEAVGRGPSSW